MESATVINKFFCSITGIEQGEEDTRRFFQGWKEGSKTDTHRILYSIHFVKYYTYSIHEEMVQESKVSVK
jgi:hypothetical protein